MKILVFLILTMVAPAFAQCPMHDEHSKHQDGVNERGDHAMGFDHMKTTHHFLLRENGGIIQVTANDPKDTKSRDEIRMHLSHIAKMFSEGNFEIPMFIHDQVPPGVPVMKERQTQIKFTYEDQDSGGQVVISTDDQDARSAIHDFLRFQITDHSTGDPLS